MSQDKKAHSSTIDGAEMEKIIAQWQRERPDIDPIVMAVCGEVWRAGERLRQGVLVNLTKYGLDFAGFDVILTLRRQGHGQSLSPSVLAKEMMLSTSAMTNRLDRLEKGGLIKRTRDVNDRRGLKIILTDDGYKLADDMIKSHVQTEENMLQALSDQERNDLRKILIKITGTPEGQ